MKIASSALFWIFICTKVIAQDYPELVLVQGGTFRMGDETGKGAKDELPAHPVSVKSFKIARTETTVLQWRVFCNATKRQMPDVPGWGWHEDHPVVNVSWDDAVAYCLWISQRNGARYRLPTEAEWEFAARGGNTSKGTVYSGHAVIDSVAWYVATGYGTKAVGTKKPNELGLSDMTGNVWEWVNDWYAGDYYSKSPEDNPSGPQTGTYKIYRGGAWSVPAGNCKVTYRNVVPPSSSNYNRGFRVAVSLD